MITFDDLFSFNRVKSCPGWPGEAFFNKKKVAVLECIEDIPCNPCETACPHAAITVGEPITNLPQINGEKCTGCKLCIAACPGHAIFVVEKNYTEDLSALSLPYELLPVPEEGQMIKAYSRDGDHVCYASVLEIMKSKKFNKTCVITVTFKKDFIDKVRSIRIG